MADVAVRLREPPPRAVSAELMRAVERPSRPMLMWGGVALASTGGGYTLIFGALGAPWQIHTGAAATAAIGVLLLIAFAVVSRRLRRLLRGGMLLEGEVLEVDAPVGGQGKRPRSASVRYRFTLPEGKAITACGSVPWTDPPPPIAAGDTLPVCVLPVLPRRHLALFPEAGPVEPPGHLNGHSGS